ncbi:hypothetical protein [Marinobacter sp. DUT-1]|uniref:hypothetical protein n=1 Tax=Marinobacter sp. DUT-1 TaxID=3412037 RepID=UPI003D17DAC0
MLIDRDLLKDIRDSKLTIHCHKVNITQKKLDDGVELEGYGIIKLNESGGLLLEFICNTLAEFILSGTSIPIDSLDEKQTLFLEAKTIDGHTLTSFGFKITPGLHHAITVGKVPYILHIDLLNIENNIQHPYESSDEEYHIELHFREPCDIPKNVSNTTESTLGHKEFSWNQTRITQKNYEINIIDHKSHTELSIRSPKNHATLLKNATLFYLGFTSGSYLQPYFEQTIYKKEVKSTILSTIKSKSNITIPPPVSGRVAGSDGKMLDDFHYSILINAIELSHQHPSYFSSLYLHWKRIWHSFLSDEFSVPMLTLGVAVEGLLNDILIPEMSKHYSNPKLEEEKELIIEKIQEIDIKKDHLKSIMKYVERWGNLHPKKCLNILAEHQIVDSFHVKNWIDLRNATAHPKTSKNGESLRKKDIRRTFISLGLFYRLVLYTLHYRGPLFLYRNESDREIGLIDELYPELEDTTSSES